MNAVLTRSRILWALTGCLLLANGTTALAQHTTVPPVGPAGPVVSVTKLWFDRSGPIEVGKTYTLYARVENRYSGSLRVRIEIKLPDSDELDSSPKAYYRTISGNGGYTVVSWTLRKLKEGPGGTIWVKADPISL